MSGHWCKVLRVSRGESLADDLCAVCGRRFGENPPAAGEWVDDATGAVMCTTHENPEPCVDCAAATIMRANSVNEFSGGTSEEWEMAYKQAAELVAQPELHVVDP